MFYTVKMLPSNLAILNIFRAPTVNGLRTAVFGTPKQLVVSYLIYC